MFTPIMIAAALQVGGTSEAVFDTPDAADYVAAVRAACPGR